jgi:hypothetical protein
MTDHIHLHQATGRVILRAIRKGREGEGLEAVNVLQWRDENDQIGQDTHVRLALHVERGGELFVEHSGNLLKVVVQPGDRFLHSQSTEVLEPDPILSLPSIESP